MRYLLLLVLIGRAFAADAPWFTDVTAASGISFRHVEGTLHRTLPEVTGAGAAVLDFDGDGVLDVFLVQGSGPGGRAEVPASRLFRGTGSGFVDVTESAGIDARGSGMAVLAADLDGDGFPDLVVTYRGRPALLFANRGDGTFARRELGGTATWGSCVAALDYDRDGLLDLFCGQYLDFRDSAPELAGEGVAVALTTLLPGRYAGLPSTLFHARGDGGYDDRTRADGVGEAPVAALGALACDLDADGWPDLVIAADGHSRNRVLQNERGHFRDASRESYGDEMRGSMGLALGGRGVAITHWLNPPALYRVTRTNRGVKLADTAPPLGLGGGPSGVGWGVAFLDVDQDGRDDLLEIRGGSAPSPDTPWSARLQPEPARLYLDRGDTFERQDGDPVGHVRVGRGAAFGDLDRDGAVDVVVTSSNGPAEIWRAAPPRASWIAFEPVGTRSARDPVGVMLEVRGRAKQLVTGDSYFSSSERALVFGLGGESGPVTARARWPSGRTEAFEALATGQRHRLVEGAGRDMK